MELVEILATDESEKEKFREAVMFSISPVKKYPDGKLLKELRTALGVKQNDIAVKLKTSQSAISREENSELSLDPEYINDYLAALNFKTSDFRFLQSLFEEFEIPSFRALTLMDSAEIKKQLSEYIESVDSEIAEIARTELIEKVKHMSPKDIEEIEHYYRMMRAEQYMKQNHLLVYLDRPKGDKEQKG